MKFNFEAQNYKGIPIKLIKRNYSERKAMRFVINNTNQNLWIPKKHLHKDGTLIEGQDIDYVFRKAQNQLNYAGITWAVPGIKRRYIKEEL